MKFKHLSILFFLCFAITALQAQVDRSTMPEPGPAPEINLGSPKTFKLKNGLKVMVVENHKFPKVRASLVIDNDPVSSGDKVGVKALYSSMMGSGTDNLDKETFNEKVDLLGARINYGAGSASASSLSRFFPEVFELMTEGLLNPRFEEEEFDSQKNRLLEGIKSQEKSAGAIAGNVNGALVYGKDHPYGEFETAESVESIDLSDVQKYYDSFISPKNAYLVVVGDVSSSEVKKLAEKYLDRWTSKEVPEEEMPEVKNVENTEIDLIDMPNAVQSEVSVTNSVKLKKADEDYFPALVANQVLGGGGEGRLFNNLREDKAFTYGAYSTLGNDKHVSRFVASASVRNAVTDSAVVEFLNEINRIRNEQVSDDELALAKAKYTGSFVRALEEPSTIASYALNIETEDLPKDFYQTYLQKLEAVTKEDVQRIAKEYFKPEKARIIVVGKGKDIAESLEDLTYDGKTFTVNYFDKKANPVDKPEFKKEVPSDITVETVYADYIEAIGGKEALEKVNTVYSMAKGSIQGQELTLEIKETKEGKNALEVSAGGMTVQKIVFNGENGYIEAQGQKQDMSDEMIEIYKEQGLFPELNIPESAEVTGIETVDDEDAYVVKLSDEKSDFYSVESGFKLQTVETTPMGEATSTYGDYKETEGIKFPYTLGLPMGPQAIELKVEEIKLNADINDADFE